MATLHARLAALEAKTPNLADEISKYRDARDVPHDLLVAYLADLFGCERTMEACSAASERWLAEHGDELEHCHA